MESSTWTIQVVNYFRLYPGVYLQQIHMSRQPGYTIAVLKRASASFSESIPNIEPMECLRNSN